MAKEINFCEIIKEIKTSNFTLNCGIPMGYLTGLPILKIVNDRLCAVIPFLKYKVTGHIDKTLVFPIRFTITVTLPERKIVGFEDLTFNRAFKNLDFNKPIGLFRHESVKQYNKTEFKNKKNELFQMYDKAASAILYGGEYTEDDDEQFRDLLNIILEPSLIPIYRALDKDFYNKYLA